jgi:hypothetical protein
VRRGRACAQMIMLCLLLTACGGKGGAGTSKAEELALNIRAEYLSMTACTAKLDVVADYGERVYNYGIDLNWKKESGYLLAVTAPEDIAGVTVSVEAGQTVLEYDGARIETGAITPDGLSPIDALPAFLDYAREGFMAECVEEELGEIQALRVSYREPDHTPGTGLEASLWFDTVSHALLRGELSSDGLAIIRCVFGEFQMA